MSGSQAASGLGATAIYGTKGTATATTIPGSRGVGTGWSDSKGNFWLFGGYGLGSDGSAAGFLNDLWEFSPASNQWTWMNGSNTTNSLGVYGTQAVAAAGNTPGARQSMASWQDASGDLWIYGGTGYDASGNVDQLNDLWMYAPATNMWTWMGGVNNTLAVTPPVYGTLGTANPLNQPGARTNQAYWTDAQGDFWMFGGYLQVDPPPGGGLETSDSSDMWEYSPKTLQWTWVGGSQTLASQANYGTQGTASSTNTPGNRESANTWVDAKGNFWLFGGSGFNTASQRMTFNDLWEFMPATGQWTWVAGSSTPNTGGTYGVQGTASVANAPGARLHAASWTDSAGNLILCGGFGLATSATTGDLGDLWSFNIATDQWTWLRGSNSVGASAIYGTQGTYAIANDPGGRDAPVAVTGPSGTLWLFGGYTGSASNPDATALNDLWKYQP